MRVAFLTNYDSENIRNWSGIGYYMAKSLERQGVELIRINCFVKFTAFQKLKRRFIRLWWHKIQQPERSPFYLKKMAGKVTRLLAGQEYDLIFAAGSLPVSFLQTDKPVVFFTDATYEGMTGLYLDKNKLWQHSFIDGNKAEENAIRNATLIFYTSEWAKRSAVHAYSAEPGKIKQLSFGPNLLSVDSVKDMQQLIDNRKQKRKKNFLFIGVNWYRKGAGIAIETISKLNEMGIPATLTIVGCPVPAGIVLPGFVIHHPFISKNRDTGMNRLRNLYERADFFLLPTQADCTPVVFSEAASFGLPVITTDVGGCRSVVVDNVTGYCIDKDNFVAAAVEKIALLCNEPALYEAFSWRAFYHYNKELNWDSIGKKAVGELQQVLKKPRSLLSSNSEYKSHS
jgi:glycosyltransferase involved in cell wall biosynthesis